MAGVLALLAPAFALLAIGAVLDHTRLGDVVERWFR